MYILWCAIQAMDECFLEEDEKKEGDSPYSLLHSEIEDGWVVGNHTALF